MDNLDPQKSYLVSGKKLSRLLRIANAVSRMEGRDGVKVEIADDNIVIKLGGLDETGPLAGINGMPDGVAYEEFTICDSGTSATRWLATWTADPS